MMYEIEARPPPKCWNHGLVWFEATEVSLDYGAPDPCVSDQLTPDEADEMARQLTQAAAAARKAVRP